MYGKIMVAVDGSKNADLALAEAVQIAMACGSEIAVVHVIDNSYLKCNPLFIGTDELHTALRADGEALLKAACDLVEAQDIPCTTRLIDEPAAMGDISTVVEQAAQEGCAELLVIGTHGRHGMHRLLLGSVAEGLVHHTKLPVLLVRA
ncbi:Nucleotide-binding universal stress protein, UspA family [Cupriavidus sp. YR651]|uniref:universal stress protein n=1 Tax=Cupriavidus sp. YR651 TaxID=1855315 RepID=UPI00088782AF|nr:universal stress protein [Cupriavidus sp. YR651]SDD82671.1 Nucleotide-binding universal stress protein, UspA family [Cupriavidus sp. YR651]